MTLTGGIIFILVLLAGIIGLWARQFPSVWAGYQFDPGDNLPSELAEAARFSHSPTLAQELERNHG